MVEASTKVIKVELILDKEKVEEVLGLDTTKYQLSLVLPFGYRINAQSTQLRVPFENVVEYIK